MQPVIRDRVQEYIKTRTTSGPIIVELDPTTACNFSCPDCINILLLNKGQIEESRTIALIDEMHKAGVKGVIFIGGGEPLAQSGMPNPILHCYKHNIKIGLTTNGSLIDRYINEISKCVTWTRVSVDASSQKTFSIFRPSNIVNSFSKVISNIELLAKSKTGLLGYSFLIIEKKISNKVLTNVHELYEAACLAKKLGCDYFEYKLKVDEHHNLIPLSKIAKRTLIEQIKKMESLNTNNFRIITPNSTFHLLNTKTEKQPKDYTTCPTLEMRTVITPKGIYPCPYKRGLDEAKIGDIDVKFDKYWTSQQRRLASFGINPKKDCPFYCIRHDMNIMLLELAKTHDKGVDLLPYMTCTETDDVFI